MAQPETLNRPEIASLWVGDAMSFVEWIVMKSFMKQGHAFTLYTLNDVGNIPTGVILRDAREIYAPTFEVGPGLRHNNAVYADIFRLFMIRDTGAIWADLDAYCLKPFEFASNYVFGIEQEPDHINNGVLGFPGSSVTLKNAIDLVTSINPIPPYFNKKNQKRLVARDEKGERFGFEDFYWGVSEPRLITHFLKESGEIEHAQAKDVFYPGPRPFRFPLIRPDPPMDRIETPITLSVHIYGKTKKFLKDHYNGVPAPGSYLSILCERHDVDPNDAPV